MKLGNFRSCIGGPVVLVCALTPATSTIATQLKEATVTEIIKQLDLLPTGKAAKPAALNDNVRDGTAVRTGSESRTELTFTDQTLARTRFSVSMKGLAISILPAAQCYCECRKARAVQEFPRQQ